MDYMVGIYGTVDAAMKRHAVGTAKWGKVIASIRVD
jgi:hypothetical protein